MLQQHRTTLALASCGWGSRDASVDVACRRSGREPLSVECLCSDNALDVAHASAAAQTPMIASGLGNGRHHGFVSVGSKGTWSASEKREISSREKISTVGPLRPRADPGSALEKSGPQEPSCFALAYSAPQPYSRPAAVLSLMYVPTPGRNLFRLGAPEGLLDTQSCPASVLCNGSPPEVHNTIAAFRRRLITTTTAFVELRTCRLQWRKSS